MAEIVEGFSHGDTECRRCGKGIHLYFNDGMLDETECCGLVYRTEATGYQLVAEVISEKQDP